MHIYIYILCRCSKLYATAKRTYYVYVIHVRTSTCTRSACTVYGPMYVYTLIDMYSYYVYVTTMCTTPGHGRTTAEEHTLILPPAVGTAAAHAGRASSCAVGMEEEEGEEEDTVLCVLLVVVLVVHKVVVAIGGARCPCCSPRFRCPPLHSSTHFWTIKAAATKG